MMNGRFFTRRHTIRTYRLLGFKWRVYLICCRLEICIRRIEFREGRKFHFLLDLRKIYL